MGQTFKQGDRVKWNTPQGKTTGKVLKRLTAPTQLKGHSVKASKDSPQYLVKSDKTGQEAAHKPDALTRVSG